MKSMILPATLGAGMHTGSCLGELKSGQRAMKPNEWKTYRTRFLIKAKQLNSNLSFVDALGRQHSGRKGDYLVESADGVVSIAPRQIFEDIYVAMLEEPEAHSCEAPHEKKAPQPYHSRRNSSSHVGLIV